MVGMGVHIIYFSGHMEKWTTASPTREGTLNAVGSRVVAPIYYGVWYHKSQIYWKVFEIGRVVDVLQIRTTKLQFVLSNHKCHGI